MTKNSTLKAVSESILSVVREIDDVVIVGRYVIGKMIEEFVKTQETIGKGLHLLEQETGIDIGLLSGFRSLYLGFSEVTIERMRRYNLKYGHAVQLLRVTSGTRPLFLKECIKNNWNTAELRERVDEHLVINGKRKYSCGGRPFYVPDSPIVGVKRLNKMLGSLIRFSELFEDDSISLDDLLQIKTSEDLVGLTRDNIDFTIRRLKAIKAGFNRARVSA